MNVMVFEVLSRIDGERTWVQAIYLTRVEAEAAYGLMCQSANEVKLVESLRSVIKQFEGRDYGPTNKDTPPWKR
jgi:hypothetical protein